MSKMTKSLVHMTRAGLVALVALTLPMFSQAAHHETAETKGRAVVVEMEAEVTAIDLKTREVTVRGPDGTETTFHAPEKLVKLEDASVGDRVVGTFFAALEGEVRTPTAEELAEPWVEMEGKAKSTDTTHPAIESARVIRAVVTIEELNPEAGTVVIKDSRGKVHMIGDVEPEKMTGVKVGQTAVVVFTQAMVLTLEKKVQVAQ